jgi:hypothetical protein
VTVNNLTVEYQLQGAIWLAVSVTVKVYFVIINAKINIGAGNYL